MGVFLFFGAAMACLAGSTLLWPGTPLDRMWELNSTAYRELAGFGYWIGIPFLLLGIALFAAGVGWFRRRRWGWGLAVGIMAIQAAGDVVNVVRGEWVRGLLGAGVATAILIWLVRPSVRSAFGSGRQS
jgi:hypothetical protein